MISRTGSSQYWSKGKTVGMIWLIKTPRYSVSTLWVNVNQASQQISGKSFMCFKLNFKMAITWNENERNLPRNQNEVFKTESKTIRCTLGKFGNWWGKGQDRMRWIVYGIQYHIDVWTIEPTYQPRPQCIKLRKLLYPGVHQIPSNTS